MTCYINFALDLKPQNSQVFYNSENLVGKISISVPEIVGIVEQFIPALEPVAIVEKPALSKSKKLKSKTNEDTVSESLNEKNIIQNNDLMETPIILQQVVEKAYICQVEQIDKKFLEKLYSGIATYIKESLSKISTKDILSIELNVVFSGLDEIMKLRAYLQRFIENPDKKEQYQKGYIFIMMA
jgi:hypothetical protein